jgi:hypothetical protein
VLPPIMLFLVAVTWWPRPGVSQLALVWSSLDTRKPWVQQYPPRSVNEPNRKVRPFRSLFRLLLELLLLLLRLLLLPVRLERLLLLLVLSLPCRRVLSVEISVSLAVSCEVSSAIDLVSWLMVVRSADMAVAIYRWWDRFRLQVFCRLWLHWLHGSLPTGWCVVCAWLFGGLP